MPKINTIHLLKQEFNENDIDLLKLKKSSATAIICPQQGKKKERGILRSKFQVFNTTEV